MLKINLLTEHWRAEKEYRKMRDGASVVNHLEMHSNHKVRRRIHQNIRNDKKQPARLAARAVRVEQRNQAFAYLNRDRFIGFDGKHEGPLNCSTVDGEKEVCVVGKQKFSRCLRCGTDFIDDKGRPTPASFAFCGERPEVAGQCKRAWLAEHPNGMKPAVTKFNTVTQEDVDWAHRQKRLHRRYK